MTQPSRPNDESEFGGAPGLVQPPPHELTAEEERMVTVRLDPSDPDSGVTEALESGQYGRRK
jgi:hypothetical protein